jgi:hypothetical protein
VQVPKRRTSNETGGGGGGVLCDKHNVQSGVYVCVCVCNMRIHV